MQSQINDLRIHVYGHLSADPAQVASMFNAQISQIAVPESDLAIFAIDPSAGIDQVTIDLWQSLDEFQVPRLVVVTHLEKLEADFDDVIQQMRKAGIRAELDSSDDRMQKKVRNAQMQKIPFMVIAGEEDQKAGAVSFRYRNGEQKNGIPIKDAIAEIKKVVQERTQV